MKGLKEKMAPYILLAPFLFWLVVFFGYAFVRVIIFSFTNYNLFGKMDFVGLKNYIDLFRHNYFLIALKNTISFSIVVTTAQTFGALLLAVILNRKMRGMKLFRTAYYMPSVTSSVVITLIFMWLFQRQGAINYILTLISQYKVFIGIFFLSAIIIHLALVFKEKLRKRPVSYFEASYLVMGLLLAFIIVYLLKELGIMAPLKVDPVHIIWLNTRENVPSWAGFFAFPRTLGSIMILNIWTTIPTFMLLYLAGLQDIPESLYQAAEMDGATTWHKFWYITVPQMSHITFLVVTMGLIGTLQMFDQVAIMGSAAPRESKITLAYYVYEYMFPSSGIPRAGFASAAAIILCLLTLIIVLLQKKLNISGEVDR